MRALYTSAVDRFKSYMSWESIPARLLAFNAIAAIIAPVSCHTHVYVTDCTAVSRPAPKLLLFEIN